MENRASPTFNKMSSRRKGFQKAPSCILFEVHTKGFLKLVNKSIKPIANPEHLLVPSP